MKWVDAFNRDDIFFITPDVKRGVGLAGILPNYHILCSYYEAIIPVLRKQGANIFCLEELKETDDNLVNNSAKLLEQRETDDYIRAHAKSAPNILYFKPSLKLDMLIRGKKYIAVGNRSEINEKFENKLNLYNFLIKYFPENTLESHIGVFGELDYQELLTQSGGLFIIQFGHGWAGKTTFLIRSEEGFIQLKNKFPQTKVKVNRYIKGFTVLNNCCIYRNKILVGPPAIQIEGIEKLCEKEQITCGRQWPVDFLTEDQKEIIYKLSIKIGNLMMKEGFKGFFGIDFLTAEQTGKIFISEVNARLTASTSFYTRLEHGASLTPLIAYHIASFLHKQLVYDYQIQDQIVGSQLIIRNKNYKINIKEKFGVYKLNDNNPLPVQRKEYLPEKLSSDEFIYIEGGANVKEEGELARIETKSRVLEAPHQLSSWINNILVRC